MTIAIWMLLAAGLIAMAYGWRSSGKPMMRLGLITFAMGVTFLLNRNGGLLGWGALVALVLLLAGIVVMSRREKSGLKTPSG